MVLCQILNQFGDLAELKQKKPDVYRQWERASRLKAFLSTGLSKEVAAQMVGFSGYTGATNQLVVTHNRVAASEKLQKSLLQGDVSWSKLAKMNNAEIDALIHE